MDRGTWIGYSPSRRSTNNGRKVMYKKVKEWVTDTLYLGRLLYHFLKGYFKAGK